MHRIIQEQHIVALIAKELTETISESERNELAEWLAASGENRKAYTQLQQMQLADELKQYQQINIQRGWKKYQQKYKRKPYLTLLRRTSIAAAVIIVAGIGLWLSMHHPIAPEESTVICPGTSRAILVLNDGSSRDLTNLKENQLLHEGLTVRNDGRTLSYKNPEPSDTEKQETAYNELRIPRGGEYQLVLADGTHVWLNSETTLRYPVHFNSASRNVFLKGEAFFEVAKDKAHPFIVHTQNEVKVQVLGTSFNVRDYGDENRVEVVLEEGAVQMEATGREVLLKPGDKGAYDLTNQNLDIQSVNTQIYTEWRKGQFIFIRKRVEDILRDLARWYNIEVFYRQETVKNILFTGNLKKYDNIRTLLEAIEIAGGIRFEIKGTVLHVDVANP